MKPLKPSARERKRYLFIKGKNLKQNIEKSILEFIGILGLSKVGLSYIKSRKDFVVICINREMLDSVRTSFAIYPEKIRVEKVSGTLKGLDVK